jgi:Spirocyclase AveC-like
MGGQFVDDDGRRRSAQRLSTAAWVQCGTVPGTVAEKLAQRARIFVGRPVLGTFVVMFIIINAAYLFAYGGWFTAIKWTRTATSVACPWPYPEPKFMTHKASTRRTANPARMQSEYGQPPRGDQ